MVFRRVAGNSRSGAVATMFRISSMVKIWTSQSGTSTLVVSSAVAGMRNDATLYVGPRRCQLHGFQLSHVHRWNQSETRQVFPIEACGLSNRTMPVRHHGKLFYGVLPDSECGMLMVDSTRNKVRISVEKTGHATSKVLEAR
jgi:hypothetical protein